MRRLENKIIVITGGAGGIGYCASRIFSEEGATVLILDLDRENGEKTVREIAAAGGKAAFYPVDISDFDAVQEVFRQIGEEYVAIDGLYNNASVFWGQKDAPLDVLDMGIFRRIVSINLFGLVHCSKCAIPLMKERGGAIVNTASSAAVIGIHKCDSYTASKGGTVALTRSMAVEYGPMGIRTNCIAPAAIRTPMVAESDLDDPDFDEHLFLNQGTPLRRWGKPEEIARTAMFLLSDDASYINGAILVADGGITINQVKTSGDQNKK